MKKIKAANVMILITLIKNILIMMGLIGLSLILFLVGVQDSIVEGLIIVIIPYIVCLIIQVTTSSIAIISFKSKGNIGTASVILSCIIEFISNVCIFIFSVALVNIEASIEENGVLIVIMLICAIATIISFVYNITNACLYIAGSSEIKQIRH